MLLRPLLQHLFQGPRRYQQNAAGLAHLLQTQIQVHRALRPLGGVRLEAGFEDLLQARRRLGAKFAQLFTAEERKLPGHRLVDHHRGAIQVRAGVHRVAGELLGRHVARRAQDGAGVGDRLDAGGVVAAVDPGDAEVQHPHVQPNAGLVEQEDVVVHSLFLFDPVCGGQVPDGGGIAEKPQRALRVA